ncbi:MAG: tRNA 5-methoxyuridine(34)/uridine 5-oxyacetic acid(34) synthase CmoB [Planctomycetota bacterium]
MTKETSAGKMQSHPFLYRTELDQLLRSLGEEGFRQLAYDCCVKSLDQPTNGDLKRWIKTLEELPPGDSAKLSCNSAGIEVSCTDRTRALDRCETIKAQLMEFHPWRKGPFKFLGWDIQTEWRSDWKWGRIADCVDWRGKVVLDVGGGNGYFGWRMLEAGASYVLGLDPILRFVMQFEVFQRYAPSPLRHFVLPMIDSDIPPKLHRFDIALSAGVLYHRTSPIDHLRSLHDALRPNGTLILETIVVDEGLLIPTDRYAQMRNVWFIPSTDILRTWLQRTGFEEFEVVDVTMTTVEEQHSTSWMTFQSLADFLDPHDDGKTIEGYPAPVRATIRAKRT